MSPCTECSQNKVVEILFEEKNFDLDRVKLAPGKVVLKRKRRVPAFKASTEKFRHYTSRTVASKKTLFRIGEFSKISVFFLLITMIFRF